jgi:hypothetical protein
MSQDHRVLPFEQFPHFSKDVFSKRLILLGISEFPSESLLSLSDIAEAVGTRRG